MGKMKSQSEFVPSSRIKQWATRQLADYDARQPGTLFAEGVVLDIEEGYALQSAVAELLIRTRRAAMSS